MLILRDRYALVRSLPKEYQVGVEVGVRNGMYSEYILMNNTNLTLYSIDPWEDNYQMTESEKMFEECSWRLKKFNERSKMIKGWSPQVTEQFDNNFFDFVYIDADHSYESIEKDIEAWWPKIKHGGILSGHDYGGNWPGIKQAVDEFVVKNNITNLKLTGTCGIIDYDGNEDSWVIQK